MRIKKSKGQSIIEYICVFLVFAAAGVATWVIASRGFAGYQNKSANQILQSGSTVANP
ncbi:MAG: hypothetical protein WC412_07660 [Candidatus Omnitrophota bacterium]|jgi:hypothetical protein